MSIYTPQYKWNSSGDWWWLEVSTWNSTLWPNQSGFAALELLCVLSVILRTKLFLSAMRPKRFELDHSNKWQCLLNVKIAINNNIENRRKTNRKQTWFRSHVGLIIESKNYWLHKPGETGLLANDSVFKTWLILDWIVKTFLHIINQ